MSINADIATVASTVLYYFLGFSVDQNSDLAASGRDGAKAAVHFSST